MTPLRRTTVAAAGLVLLAGCSGGTAERPAPRSAPSPTEQTSPTRGASPDGLDVALSEPREDSVYPEVGEPTVDALHYDLDLTWDPRARLLQGVATIDLRATGGALQLDLAPELEVSEVTLDGEPVEATHDGKDLRVDADVTADQRYELAVTYAGTPEPTAAPTTRSDIDGLGWTTTEAGEVWTMQEPYGAFTWYPVNDQPADKALYDITVTAPDPLVAVANGSITAQSSADGATTTTWEVTSPLSSYLVTVAIGDYTSTTVTSASGVDITNWVPRDRPGLADRLAYAADGLDWLEARLGPYPFDSLGFVLVDSTSGMETQTMITLGTSSYATSPDVLVHELAHQWYGDEVTPDDWRDVWMNEGMAMYLQGVWQAETTGQDLDVLMGSWVVLERRLRAEAGPPGDYDPRRFGSSNVYYGPALMWHALRRQIGDEAFWRVTRAWPALEPERNASREDYLPWLVEQTGVPRSFFDAWLLDDVAPSLPAAADSGPDQPT